MNGEWRSGERSGNVRFCFEFYARMITSKWIVTWGNWKNFKWSAIIFDPSLASDFRITRLFPDIKSFARENTFSKIGKGVVLIPLYEALTLILTSNIKLTFSYFFGSNVEILNTFVLSQYVILAINNFGETHSIFGLFPVVTWLLLF